MTDFISNYIQQQHEGLLFKINPENGFQYDYFNYSSSLTDKRIPKKVITFFFVNLSKRLNFKSLQESTNIKKTSDSIIPPLIFAEICFYFIIIIFIVRIGLNVWLYLIIPFIGLILNLMAFIFIRNLVVLKTHTNNSIVRMKVNKHLAIENIYWFLKYRVVFEMDEDLNIVMVDIDKKFHLSEKEYNLVEKLSEKISDEELKKWRDNNLSMEDERSIEEDPSKKQNEWVKNEFSVFFKYNKWDMKQ